MQLTEPAPAPEPWSFKLDSAWVGRADFDHGGATSVVESRIQLAWQHGLDLPLIGGVDPHWVLRAGLEWERYGFNLSSGMPHYIPGTLQSTTALLGVEYRTEAGLGALLEARPGFFYEHDLSGQAFDVPVQGAVVVPIGDRLAIIAGASYSGFRKIPVKPFPGIWWKISDSIVLNAIPPNPRLEFIVSEQTRWWIGAELAGGSYRTDADDEGKLNAAAVTYSDYRAGAGIQWNFARDWSLETGAGVSFRRKYDFQRAEVGVASDDSAPFLKFSLRGEW